MMMRGSCTVEPHWLCVLPPYAVCSNGRWWGTVILEYAVCEVTFVYPETYISPLKAYSHPFRRFKSKKTPCQVLKMDQNLKG